VLVLTASGLVVLGLLLLVAGGESLVRGAVSLARLLRVSTAVIGLTIVAAGTSMPEMAVSLLAALEGRSDLAVGNVVGSNIFNVAAILGVSALVVPLAVHTTAVRREWPAMAVVSLLLPVVAWDGVVSRIEGGLLVVGLAAFTSYLVRLARREGTADPTSFAGSVDRWSLRGRRVLMDSGIVAFGLVLLVAGARLLVEGAVRLAEAAGMPERVIGLTIVAAGTSMPELAASLVAAWRKETDIALANVIGSNIFNIAGILGAVAVVTPQHVNPAMVASDIWWMLAAALVLFPMMRTGMRIGRLEGGALLLAYGVYVALLVR
jgi:cation:H+ antiporter